MDECHKHVSRTKIVQKIEFPAKNSGKVSEIKNLQVQQYIRNKRVSSSKIRKRIREKRYSILSDNIAK